MDKHIHSSLMKENVTFIFLPNIVIDITNEHLLYIKFVINENYLKTNFH